MTRTTDEVLDALFAAIPGGDIAAVEALYADDIEVWHNVTGQAMDKAANLKLLGFWSRTVSDMRYEVLERRVYDGGAMQRHVVHGAVDGTTLRAEVAIVFHVADGQITNIYEYLDPAAVAPVFGS